jgi:hypothetical protein
MRVVWENNDAAGEEDITARNPRLDRRGSQVSCLV